MIYYGIFPDGNFISNINLTDLIKIKGIEYFLREEHSLDHNVGSRFTLIHPNGEPYFFRVNAIELRNIGIQYYVNHERNNKAEFTFYDYDTESTFQVHLTTGNTPKFVKAELIPFMQSYNSTEEPINSAPASEITDVKKLEDEIAVLKERLKFFKNHTN